MTLPTDNIRDDAIGTGATATYSYTFKIFEETDLVVTVVDTAGNESIKTLNVDYTVPAAGIGQQAGGSIILSAPLASGYGIIIRARSDLTQETSIRNQSGFNPAVVEREFDLLCRADQVQQEQIDRSLKAAVTDPDTLDMTLPPVEVRKGKALYFDPSTGEPTVTGAVSGLPDTSVILTLDTIAQLKALTAPSGAVTYLVRGYTTLGDGGPQLFRWNSSDLTADNGGTIIARTAGGTGRFNAVIAKDLAPRQFGAKGDGATDDTAKFTTFETVTSGHVIDLGGLTYVVTAIPPLNIYVNGSWKIGGTLFQAGDTPASISDATDTGGVEAAYGGGTIPVPTVSGRSTYRLRSLLASQNCRSTFARSINIASIYSQANGNLSGNICARQSIADCPQSVNIASEECVVYGFRGINAGSEFSRCEGSSSWNVGSDTCRSSAENAGNLGSFTCVAGRGWGLNVTLTVTAGVITGYVINSGGIGYNIVDVMSASDRINTPGVAAVFTFTVDVSGTVTSITIVNGGTGYSAGSTVDLRVATRGAYSAHVGSARGISTQQFAVTMASDTCTVNGRESACIASDTCNTQAENSAVIASTTGSAVATSADRSVVVAGNNSQVNAAGGVIIGGLNCTVDHAGTTVVGRRTASFLANSWVFGDSAAGSTLSANRKFQITAAGNVTAAGTFTGGTVFADYAELFENVSNGTIPLGSLVALEGRKVRIAAAGDSIAGVVSATALIVAGDSQFQWSARFLTGEFGEPLYDTIPNPDFGLLGAASHIQVPRPNPAYDEARPNVARSERPDEWTVIGLLGQVHVRVSAEVSPDDYVKAIDGGVGHYSDTATNLRCLEIRRPFDSTKGYAVALCLIR